jgi:hypothetical protein
LVVLNLNWIALFIFVQDLLPILALTALSLLLLYLIAIATTTTTAAARIKKRSHGSIDDNDLVDDENVEPDIGKLFHIYWCAFCIGW